MYPNFRAARASASFSTGHVRRVALVGVLLLVLAASACSGEKREPVRVGGPAQGTTYSVTVMNPPADLDRARIKAAMDELVAKVDDQMSTWRDDSEITRFNEAASGEWVPVSPELATLTARALSFGRETDGAFDVTLGPILKVWGFGADASEPSHLPNADELAAAREKAGIGLVEVREQPPALRKRAPDVTLDLAGLAQGYTVDLMAKRLDALGAKRYLAELGGELYAKGNKHGSSPWRIGVEKPKAGTREIERVVGLANAGMTTSGDYRDYFELDGRRFSHTIDPRTGRPVAHDLRAVTVIAEDAMTADAMATALLVMGPQRGLAYANAHDLAALFVSGEAPGYTETYSDAFEPYIEESK